MWDKVDGVRRCINFYLFFSYLHCKTQIFLAGESVCGMVATGEAIPPNRYKNTTSNDNRHTDNRATHRQPA